MKEVLEKAVNNLAIAAFVPALAFVVTASVLFAPIVPPALRTLLGNLFDQSTLFIILLTAIIGFTLLNMKNLIYRFYRGYYVIEHIPVLNRLERKSARRLRKTICVLESQIDSTKSTAKNEESVKELEARHYALCAFERDTFPTHPEPILTTRFGNILRAAEAYSAYRYGIDAVLIWPRLMQCIPIEQAEKIEQANNQMAFSIFSSLLSLVLSMLCLVAALYQHIISLYSLTRLPSPIYFISIDPASDIYRQRAILYVVIATFMAIVAWIFYRSALPLAGQFGNMFKSAFDLFRFELLKHLSLELPTDSDEEYDAWRKISEFFMHGRSFGPLYFEYIRSGIEEKK